MGTYKLPHGCMVGPLADLSAANFIPIKLHVPPQLKKDIHQNLLVRALWILSL